MKGTRSKDALHVFNVIGLTLIAGLLLWRTPTLTRAQATDDEPVRTATQEARPASAIHVQGASAIRVRPDRIVVSIGIEAFANSPSDAQRKIYLLSEQVLEAITEQGIEANDVSSDHFILRPRYAPDEYRERVTGYWVETIIAVTLHETQDLEPIMVAALESGASAINGVEFSVSNLRELKDRARRMAVEAAMEKASDMASAADMAMGDVTEIQEMNTQHRVYSWWWGPRQRQDWTSYQNVVQDLASEQALTLEDGRVVLGEVVVQATVGLSATMIPKENTETPWYNR